MPHHQVNIKYYMFIIMLQRFDVHILQWFDTKKPAIYIAGFNFNKISNRKD